MTALISSYVFTLLLPPPPRSTLFPYTTLFRSRGQRLDTGAAQPARQAAVCHRRFAQGRRDLRQRLQAGGGDGQVPDRKSTRLNSSHLVISYAVFCLKKKISWVPVPMTRSKSVS